MLPLLLLPLTLLLPSTQGEQCETQLKDLAVQLMTMEARLEKMEEVVKKQQETNTRQEETNKKQEKNIHDEVANVVAGYSESLSEAVSQGVKDLPFIMLAAYKLSWTSPGTTIPYDSFISNYNNADRPGIFNILGVAGAALRTVS